MKEITAATTEQSMSIEQVNQAVTQMDDVTQQNAALVEEASAAAESMLEQANALDAAMSTFKLDVRNGGTSIARHVAQVTAQPQRVVPTSRRERMLAKVKTDKDGDWKVF